MDAGHRHVHRRYRRDDLVESPLDGRDRAGLPHRHRRLCGRRHVPPVESSRRLERGDDLAGVRRKRRCAARDLQRRTKSATWRGRFRSSSRTRWSARGWRRRRWPIAARPKCERERAAAERAKAAEEQAEVVRRLGAGLKDLAGGDLMVRLGDGFSPTYAQIRDDFNEAIDQLKATILSVVESAGAIKSGAQEISTASDDLSRRTEQQAANLEQTAATLGEDHRDGEEVRRRREPCAAGGGRRRRGRQARARASCVRRSKRWARSPSPRSRSARSSA